MIGTILLVAALAQNGAASPSTPPTPLKSVVAVQEFELQAPRLMGDAVALFDASPDALVQALQKRSFDVQDEHAPILVARREHEGATRTIGFWFEITDATAKSSVVEPPARGATPDVGHAPDRVWRFQSATITGRYELAALLAAIDAIDAVELELKANIVVVLDRTRRLRGHDPAHDFAPPPRADVWCVLAGTPYPSPRATLAFGARGRVDVEFTVLGATEAVDAGALGSLAPNPALLLAQEISSMRDDRGNVLIPGFFDDLGDPPDAALIAQARNAADPFEESLQSWLGIAEVETQGVSIASLAMRPTLDVISLHAGDDSTSRDQIAQSASAHLRLFTIDGQLRAKAVARVREHLEYRAWFMIDREPNARERAEHWHIARLATQDAGFDARRTHLDHRLVQPLFDAMFTIEGKPPIVQPALGEALDLGFLPLADGGACVVLPHGFVARPGGRDDATVGAWFHCMETLAAVLELGARD